MVLLEMQRNRHLLLVVLGCVGITGIVVTW